MVINKKKWEQKSNKTTKKTQLEKKSMLKQSSQSGWEVPEKNWIMMRSFI